MAVVFEDTNHTEKSITYIQNKAAKYFLAVGKRTFDTVVLGEMGLTTCYTKQKRSCLRLNLKCKIVRVSEDRLISKLSSEVCLAATEMLASCGQTR